LGTYHVKSLEAVEEYSEGYIDFFYFFQESAPLIYLKVGHDPLVTIYRLITHNYFLLRCTIFATENKSLSKVQGYYDPPRHVPTLLYNTPQSKVCS
jgi:hypothetical protein